MSRQQFYQLRGVEMGKSVQPGDTGSTKRDIHTLNGVLPKGTEVTAQSTPENTRTGSWVKTTPAAGSEVELDVEQVNWR